MQDVRNLRDKLVCRIDTEHREVEIVQKGCKTLIRFNQDGTAEAINTEAAKTTSLLHYHRETGGIDMFPFSESAYTWLKWLATNVLPALAALAGTVGLAVGFSKTDIVVTIIAAVATFVRTLVGVSTGANKRQQSATTMEKPPPK
jgi:hypothetical protein